MPLSGIHFGKFDLLLGNLFFGEFDWEDGKMIGFDYEIDKASSILGVSIDLSARINRK